LEEAKPILSLISHNSGKKKNNLLASKKENSYHGLFEIEC